MHFEGASFIDPCFPVVILYSRGVNDKKVLFAAQHQFCYVPICSSSRCSTEERTQTKLHSTNRRRNSKRNCTAILLNAASKNGGYKIVIKAKRLTNLRVYKFLNSFSRLASKHRQQHGYYQLPTEVRTQSQQGLVARFKEKEAQ